MLLWFVGHDEGVGDGRELLLVEGRLGVAVGLWFGIGIGIGLRFAARARAIEFRLGWG